jgi:hypothetical protein
MASTFNITARETEEELKQREIPPALWFDYPNQAWVRNGRYIRCGHPESMDCGCYGREHESQVADSSLYNQA